MIEDLQRLAKQLGRAPLTTEYEHLGSYSLPVYRNEFGNWRDSLLAANIEPGTENRRKFSDSEISGELKRLGSLLGHSPSFTELKQHSIVSPDTFGRRVGRTDFKDHFHPPVSPDWNIDKVNPEDGAWIAGIVTGEGCFVINRTSTDFKVGLRADDKEVLEFIKATMDLPSEIRTYSNKLRRSRGELAGDESRMFCTNRQVARLRVVPFFNRFQLRGRKALDFAIYREAIEFLCKRDDEGRYRKRLTPQESAHINELSLRLKALRKDPTAFLKE